MGAGGVNLRFTEAPSGVNSSGGVSCLRVDSVWVVYGVSSDRWNSPMMSDGPSVRARARCGGSGGWCAGLCWGGPVGSWWGVPGWCGTWSRARLFRVYALLTALRPLGPAPRPRGREAGVQGCARFGSGGWTGRVHPSGGVPRIRQRYMQLRTDAEWCSLHSRVHPGPRSEAQSVVRPVTALRSAVMTARSIRAAPDHQPDPLPLLPASPPQRSGGGGPKPQSLHQSRR